MHMYILIEQQRGVDVRCHMGVGTYDGSVGEGRRAEYPLAPFLLSLPHSAHSEGMVGTESQRANPVRPVEEEKGGKEREGDTGRRERYYYRTSLVVYLCPFCFCSPLFVLFVWLVGCVTGHSQSEIVADRWEHGRQTDRQTDAHQSVDPSVASMSPTRILFSSSPLFVRRTSAIAIAV